MTQANNVAIESSQINSSGVLLTTGGGTGLSTVGTNGQVLTSNGTTLSWVTPTTTSPGGSAGYVQYNNGTTFAGSANFTYSSNTLFLSGFAGEGFRLTSTSTNGSKLQIFSNAQSTNQFQIGQGYATGTDNIAYIYNSANADLLFATNATERMRITSAGNVGIGSTAPSGKLTVAEATNDARIYLIATNTSRAALIDLQGTISGYNWLNSTNNGTLDWRIGGGAGANILTFCTGSAGTEQMRINSNGKLLIANTGGFGNGGLLELDANANGNNYNGINIRGGVSSYASVFYSTPGNFAYFTTSGSGSNGTITWNGSNTVYATTSDQRLKENIVDAPSALNKINSVKIRSFNWIDSKIEVDFGVIAQELVEVAPEAVHVPQKEEENWGVDTAVLVPTMIKAIQELTAKVTALEAKVG